MGAPSATRGTASPVRRALEDLRARIAAGPIEGAVADYIPELARADPEAFGIAVATAEGEVHAVGDAGVPFTIQSISKPLLYGLALEEHGVEAVLARVGVEPTGEAFNSIRLGEGGAPLNPMVNAGAIATTGMVRGATPAERLDRVLAALSRYAGRPLRVDGDVYRSEKATGHRNRAIVHLLRNFSIVEGDPEDVLDLYFRQCSVEVTCEDLAAVGATLANRGVNPVSGERALAEEHVPSVLSVMATCGMYDFAGQWLFDIGLPAKSGVAGGILAVLPGQLGIGCWSPPLDRYGNSARGIRVCREISAGLGLHVLDPPRPGVAVIRASATAASRVSPRRRSPEAMAALHASGDLIRVHALQGDLMFTTAASVARTALDEVAEGGFVILDLSRLSAVDRAGAEIVAGLRPALEERGAALVLAGAGRPGLAPDHEALEAALEWCEDRLLERLGIAPDDEGPVAPGDSELCRGMTAAEVADLEAVLAPDEVAPGEAVFRAGDPGDHLVLLTRGRAAFVLPGPDGGGVRLLTLTAGMFIGEVGLLDGRPRPATVIAETPVAVGRLPRAALAHLRDDGEVRTRTKVLLNLAASLSERLRLATTYLALNR
jgi:glutaminase